MKLRYDPFQIFRASKTPAGLYARQKWLDESGSSEWKKDYEQTVTVLSSYAFPEILNFQEALNTIGCLFGLHLTVRSSTAVIDEALLRLFSRIGIQSDRIEVRLTEVDRVPNFSALPFTRSRPETMYVSASLFLASIFDQDQDPQVLSLYEWLCEKGISSEGTWLDPESTHNAFRALVVHPKYCQTRAARLVVDYLAGFQTDEGDWGPRFPIYQTVNALAHLELKEISSQLDRAFHYIWKNQNSDGTWGRNEAEWNTFLVVHALKNRGLV